MNWRLILLLSMFGLAMGIATVYVLPSRLEGVCWLVIFVTCGFVIARRAPGNYFLHGFFVGLTNWVWVAAAHVLLFDAYVARHGNVTAAGSTGGIAVVMRRYDLPVPGLSGIVIGLLAWIASKIVGRQATSAAR